MHPIPFPFSTLPALSLSIFILSLWPPLSSSAGPLKPIKGNVQVGKLKLSPMGIGTWSWGNRFLWQYKEEEDVELEATFDYCLSKGINWFDTADSYGTGDLEGRAEKLLGTFGGGGGKQRGNKALFATKLAPFPSRLTTESMTRAGLESLERLQRKEIDILQLHWPPFWLLPQLNERFEAAYLLAFHTLIQDGRATQIGVSNYGPKTLARAARVASELGSPIYSNQVQFSLLSRSPIESGGVGEACGELGIQPIGYSALGLGLLTDRYSLDNLPKGPRGLLFREYLPKIEFLLATLRDIARRRGKTVAQVALNWNLSKGFLLLVGVRSVSQAKENLGALGWSLSAGEVEEIDRAASKVRVQLVQNSFQTK